MAYEIKININIAPYKNDLIAIAAVAAVITGLFARHFIYDLTLMMVEFEGASQWNPFWTFARNELSRGHFALWTPHTLGGWPLVGFPHSALFYPLSRFFYTMMYAEATVYNTWLHLTISALLMYRLMRRVGRSPFAAAVAALIWSSSGFFFVFSTFIPLLWTITWSPLLFDSAIAWLKKGRRVDILLFVFAAGMSILGGSIESFFYEMMTIAVAVAFLTMRPSVMAIDRNRVFSIGLALMPIVLLSAIQLMPAFELSSKSVRSVGLSYEYFAARGLPAYSWLFTAVPYINPSILFSGKQFGFWEMIRFTPYIGMLATVFFIVSLFGKDEGRSKRRWLAAFVLFWAIFLSRGIGVIARIEYLIPLVNMFREPIYGLFIPQMIMIALAAAGVERFVASSDKPSLSRSRAAIVAILLLTGNLLVAWRIMPRNPDLSLACLLVVSPFPDHTRIQYIDGLTIRRADGYPFFHYQTMDGWEGTPILRYSMFLDLIDDRAIEFDDSGKLKEVGHHRVFKEGHYLKPQRLPFLNLLGVERFIITDVPEESLQAIPLKRSGSHFINPTAFPHAFMVHIATQSHGMKESQEWLKNNPDILRYEAVIEAPVELPTMLSSAAREIVASEPVTFASYVPPDHEVLSFTAIAPGYLILTDNHFPGWETTLDGKSVKTVIADLAFRGVPIPSPGAHKVEFVYRPVAFRIGLWTTIVSMLMLLCAELPRATRRLS